MYYHYYDSLHRTGSYLTMGSAPNQYKLISYCTVNEWGSLDLEKDPDEMENSNRSGYRSESGL